MNASSGVVHEASSLLSPMLILDAAILAIIAAMIQDLRRQAGAGKPTYEAVQGQLATDAFPDKHGLTGPGPRLSLLLTRQPLETLPGRKSGQ
jgi:hypothetical protein